MLKPESLCMVIADISGYTTYLAGVELDHAQDILGDLISTVATALRPTFRLAKLEGDAAFVVAPAERIDASLLLDTIERCYFGFRRRRRDVRQATSCECNACVRIPDLDLKFVIHSGQVIRQRIAGWEELVGADVIVEEILDWRPYDYLTLRSTMPTPGGVVKFLTTMEFEPTAEGTVVRQIHAAPKTAKERAIFTQMGPIFEGIFEQSSRALRASLEAAIDDRRAEGPQAALPPVREGGTASAVRV